MRRVAVTGTGLVTPLGVGTNTVWDALLACRSGIRTIDTFEIDDLACQIAGYVPRTDRSGDNSKNEAAGLFDPDSVMSARERRRAADFILYALAATEEAVRDAGWQPGPEDKRAQERTGVLIGAGIGGLETIQDAANTLTQQGPRRLSPFVLPSMLINLASGQVSIRFGFKGPNHSVVTACASGAHAIGDAARLIQNGDADVMIAGGSEAAICRLGVAAFLACRALSTRFNDRPEAASRPWDKDRDGFVMGEGSGILVLEEWEHAMKRGAKVYGEIIGYGLSGDAHHITAPAEDGDGGYRAMQSALEDSGLNVEDIGYVNAHGTSTPRGDEIEVRAVERLFGTAAQNIKMSSTKSAIGHLLGAAGAVEAIFSLLALKAQTAPPTLNLDNPSLDTPIDLCAKAPASIDTRYAMSNSFGFGGTNATLIVAAP